MKFTERKNIIIFSRMSQDAYRLSCTKHSLVISAYKLNFCCYNCADITSTFIDVNVPYRTFVYMFIADLIC